jgi:hypothetical protein
MASAIGYLAIALFMGRQVIDAFGTRIASDPGDPLLTAAILAWNATHVPWTDAWYQFPIFFPTPDVLTLSEHLLGVSLLAAPIQWLTGNPIAAYNATLLLSYPLCGVAMCALIWRLTRNAPAAFLAGLAYAFAPYRASHLPHIQMLVAFWMPLALLGLHAYVETRRWPWLVLFAISWMLQGAANGYYLVYFTLVVVMWVTWFMLARRRWRDVAAVATALVAAILPLAPILYRYLSTHHALGLSRNIGEVSVYSGDIAAPLCAPAGLTFWGWLRVACGAEGELFAGGTLIALCVAGAVWGRSWGPASADQVPWGPALAGLSDARHSRMRVVALRVALAIALLYGAITIFTLVMGPWRMEVPWRASASTADKPASVTLFFLLLAVLLSRRFHAVIRRGSTDTFYLLCAAVCWVLAWGPFPRLFGEAVLYQAPYAWLLRLPGFDALRAPARLWMMVVLSLVVFMGLTVARLLAAKMHRAVRIIGIVAACGLVADGLTRIPTADVPPTVATSELQGRTVLVLPIGDMQKDIGAVYHAVTQKYRAINGYSGYEPPYYEALRTMLDAGDGRLFEPFVSRGDVDVLVSWREMGLRALIEQQPGSQRVSEGQIFHYRVPSRDVPPVRTQPAGVRIPVRDVQSVCSREVGFITDADLGTRWVCGIKEPDQSLTVDLGASVRVGTIVHALGPAGGEFPRHLIIETSMDGLAWTRAWEGSPAVAVLHAAMAAPRETRAVIEFPPRTARYIRLTQLAREGTYAWALAELEVWSGAP